MTGEYQKLYDYFYGIEDNGSEGSFMGLSFFIFLYGLICSILTSSFFISNEKNSSLITKLLSNSRAIFVTVALHIFDKKKNKLNTPILLGLILAIIGSILINIESIMKNINKHKLKEEETDNISESGDNNDNISQKKYEKVGIKMNITKKKKKRK